MLSIVDLCSGTGGISLGMQMAGHSVLRAYDIDPVAVENYNRNIGNHAFVADLRQLHGDDLPDCDAIVGGPPCQPFSHSHVNETGPGDDRNMLPEFVRIVLEKRPSVFVFENVPQLMFSYGEYLGSELQRLARVGYWPVPIILNASSYGVPQDRKRLICIGYRDGRMPIFPSPTHSRRSARTTRQALDGLLDDPDDALPNYLSHLADENDKLINGSNRSTMKDGSRKIMWRSIDRPSFTVLAGGNSLSKAWIARRAYTLRARQLAALQSFPNTWGWPQGYEHAKQLIGNAVPPLLAYHVGMGL